jgi:hypothetical protein
MPVMLVTSTNFTSADAWSRESPARLPKGAEWDSLKDIFLKKNPFEPPFFRNPAVRMVRVRTQASFVHRAGHQGIQNRGVS